MNARIRTAALSVRDWIVSPVTMAVSVLIAVAMAVWLVVDPPAEVVGPPAGIESAKVGGYCARIVTGFDGTVWALAPGSVDGQLRRVDAADVNRDAPECPPAK